MTKPSHITVTAPPGRLVPIHPNDGRAPGGHLLYVDQGKVRRVRLSPDVTRAIADGDLIPCDMNGARVPSVDLAAAPEHVEHGDHASPTRLWEHPEPVPRAVVVPPPIAETKKGGAS